MAPSPNGPPLANDPSQGRGLTVLYVFALSTVALLSIGAQLLIQRQLSNGESDSEVINIAGRQRMLSQRLAKAALRLDDASAAERDGCRAELRETLSTWTQYHAVLQQGDDELGVPGDNSEAISRLFAAVEEEFQSMRSAAERLLAAPADEPPSEEDILAIQAGEAGFLTGMDRIVSQYVTEAERKVARLRRLESAILALTLGVLLAEGLLIFRPAVQRIEQTVERLGLVGERLRRAKEQAENANAAKTRFLANVSHELRTPMTAVLGMTELARDEQDEAQRARYLGIVEEAGNSLLGLLNDLIDLARIDAGQTPMESQPFDPQEVVDRVVRMMQAAAWDKEIGLSSGGGVDAGLWVCGDAGRLEQVLLNLVANAIKSTPKGSVVVGCTLVSRSGDRAVLSYSVRDTGVGIDPADQERIFEPFFQVRDGVAAESTGAGLGLAICRRIAEAMDAKITVLSTKGVGTTVTLTADFPLASSQQPAAIEPPNPEPVAPTRDFNVLVVEDTEVNQILLRELLTRAGHTTTVASSGEQALDHYQSSRYDLVLIDLHLPGIDGSTTAEEMLAIDAGRGAPPPPMLCVTAHAAAQREEVDPAGVFDAILTKPLRRADLFAAIGATLAEQDSETQSVGQAMTNLNAPFTEASKQDPALMRELANAYLAAAGPQHQALEDALREQRLWDASVLAHRFRGQLAYFGHEPLAEELSRLEQACIDNQVEAALAAGPSVLGRLSAASEELKSTYQPNSSGEG